jgi:hypothetical protein
MGHIGTVEKLIWKLTVKETGDEVVDWIKLAQDRITWQALVKSAINIRVA